VTLIGGEAPPPVLVGNVMDFKLVLDLG